MAQAKGILNQAHLDTKIAIEATQSLHTWALSQAEKEYADAVLAAEGVLKKAMADAAKRHEGNLQERTATLWRAAKEATDKTKATLDQALKDKHFILDSAMEAARPIKEKADEEASKTKSSAVAKASKLSLFVSRLYTTMNDNQPRQSPRSTHRNRIPQHTRSCQAEFPLRKSIQVVVCHRAMSCVIDADDCLRIRS